MEILEDPYHRLVIKHDKFTKKIDIGQLLTIAGLIISAAASFIASEQQKQTNHEIAQEVADILRAEMRKEL